MQAAQKSETEIEQPEMLAPAPEVVAAADDPIVGQATPRAGSSGRKWPST